MTSRMLNFGAAGRLAAWHETCLASRSSHVAVQELTRFVHWGKSLAWLCDFARALLRRILHPQKKGLQFARFKLKHIGTDER
jgi:hypothetical protein